ncbi:hypothetical protein N7528_006579 [Penicillium herquei]|nr:hypothetical protein N7528_006579 [Penicillium herquei]
MAGAARVDITPDINPNWLPLNEYELEKLHIRAIVFENNGDRGALIGVEIANYEQPVYEHMVGLVAAWLNVSASRIIFSATHTHGAAPWGSGLFFTEHNYGNQAVNKYPTLGDAALVAVKEAYGKMVPAQIGHAKGEAYLNVNRDHMNPLTGRWTQFSNFSGPVDREVQVLTFTTLNNTPIAAYTTYPMHPVNSYLAGYCSADWPGAMSRWIEQSLGNDMVAVYSHSASGDVNPRCRRTGTNNLASICRMPINGLELAQEPIEEAIRDFYLPLVRPDVTYIRQLFSELTAVGIVMGEEVIRLISSTTTWDKDPRIWSKQANVTCPGRARVDDAREGVPGYYTNSTDIDIMTGALGLGDLVLPHVGAEIFTRIGWRIMDESVMNKTMLVTMANGWSSSGYIADVESVSQEVFQTLGSKLVPGSCAENKIVSSLSQYIKEYKSNL